MHQFNRLPGLLCNHLRSSRSFGRCIPSIPLLLVVSLLPSRLTPLLFRSPRNRILVAWWKLLGFPADLTIGDAEGSGDTACAADDVAEGHRQQVVKEEGLP